MGKMPPIVWMEGPATRLLPWTHSPVCKWPLNPKILIQHTPTSKLKWLMCMRQHCVLLSFSPVRCEESYKGSRCEQFQLFSSSDGAGQAGLMAALIIVGLLLLAILAVVVYYIRKWGSHIEELAKFSLRWTCKVSMQMWCNGLLTFDVGPLVRLQEAESQTAEPAEHSATVLESAIQSMTSLLVCFCPPPRYRHLIEGLVGCVVGPGDVFV